MSDKKKSEKLDVMVKNLPSLPGVYQFFGEGKILYIGKAKNLKNRVQTYFRKDDKRSLRIEKLMEKVDDLKYIEVDTELEAFILETNLIKELCPRYNVLMKDDKNYAYIKVTQNEDFPLVEVVRKMEKDGARYFGPKTSASKARETVDLLHKLFRFRNCQLGLKAKRIVDDYGRNADGNIEVEVTNKVINYPCLEYHIKRCDAPCIGRISPEEYQRAVKDIIAFLEGKQADVIKHLKERMAEAVLAKKFEYAAVLRDKLLAVESVQEKQKISEATFASRDIISFVIAGDKAFFNVFAVRDGKLINQENFIVDTQLKGLVDQRDKDLKAEILERFIRDFYENSGDLPKEILISEEDIDTGFLEKWLSMEAGFSVKIHVPKKGDKSKLLELSLKNAESFAAQCEVKWDTEQARTVGACKDLAEALGVKGKDGEPYLKRIECFDISHISGHETVASMAVFENGKPKKSDYRHFTIRTLGNGDIDDFKSMGEVLARRLKYLKNVKPSEFDEVVSGWKGYKVRKAKKTELKTVNELKKAGGWNPADNVNGYFLMENPEGETVGVCCIVEKSSKIAGTGNAIHHLKNLYIADSERGKDLGRFMISKVISEVESPVVYIVTGLELLEYYEEFGFKALKSADVPSVLAESVKACEKKYSGVIVMKFDKENMYSKYGQLKVKNSNDKKSNTHGAKLAVCDKWAKPTTVFEFTGEVFKTPVCNVRVQILDKKGALITEVEVKDAYKGRGIEFEVFEHVYKDIDTATFYLLSARKDADAYLKNGFEEIKTAPQEVLRHMGKGDTILANYKAKQQKEDASFALAPDLIVIDGGKGQLSSAMKAVKDAGVTVNVCSLAKKQEDVYVPRSTEPILLEKDSNAQYLLQRIRDEAHRFAITHNRSRREKEMLK